MPKTFLFQNSTGVFFGFCLVLFVLWDGTQALTHTKLVLSLGCTPAQLLSPSQWAKDMWFVNTS